MTTANNINRRRNQRPGNCDKCRAYVEAQAGYLFLMRGCNSRARTHEKRARGEWHVRCEACTLQTASVKRETKQAETEGEPSNVMYQAQYAYACGYYD